MRPPLPPPPRRETEDRQTTQTLEANIQGEPVNTWRQTGRDWNCHGQQNTLDKNCYQMCPDAQTDLSLSNYTAFLLHQVTDSFMTSFDFKD